MAINRQPPVTSARGADDEREHRIRPAEQVQPDDDRHQDGRHREDERLAP
jgi:hypothetical protein